MRVSVGGERVASGAERVVVQAWAHAGDGGSEETADGERQRYAERCTGVCGMAAARFRAAEREASCRGDERV